MRSIGSLFHPPPSDEFTAPHLGGLQHIWKRVFEHVVDRGDTYKRSAFNSLHDKSKALDENAYADLRVSHDALSIERDVLIDAYHKPTNLSLDLVARAHAYKNRAKLLYKAVLKTLEMAKPSPPSSRQDTLVSYRFPGSPPATPSNDCLSSDMQSMRAQKVTESLLPVDTLENDAGLQPQLLERSNRLNPGLTGRAVIEALCPTPSCPSITESFTLQQYHMYMHEDLRSSGTITTSSRSNDEQSEQSENIQASEVVACLDNIDGDINVDAVVDLLQSAEGSADDALLTHVVEMVREKCGEATAYRLQDELDDRVRASSSSGLMLVN